MKDTKEQARDDIHRRAWDAIESAVAQEDGLDEGRVSCVLAALAEAGLVIEQGWQLAEMMPTDGTPVLVELAEPMLKSCYHVAIDWGNTGFVGGHFRFDAPPILRWRFLPTSRSAPAPAPARDAAVPARDRQLMADLLPKQREPER